MIRTITQREQPDAYIFNLDYERRDVAKNVFGPFPNVCLGCGDTEKKQKKCGSCGVARYCSVECQRSHWSDHKRSCGEMKAEADMGLAILPFDVFTQLWEW